MQLSMAALCADSSIYSKLLMGTEGRHSQGHNAKCTAAQATCWRPTLEQHAQRIHVIDNRQGRVRAGARQVALRAIGACGRGQDERLVGLTMIGTVWDHTDGLCTVRLMQMSVTSESEMPWGTTRRQCLNSRHFCCHMTVQGSQKQVE